MKTFDELRTKYAHLIRPGFFIECHEGWIGILDRYFEVLDRELPEGVVYEIHQVKEKLGSLRILRFELLRAALDSSCGHGCPSPRRSS